MNTTGRLPAVAIFHRKMNIRLTVTICPATAPVDTQGVIEHIELDAVDRIRWARNKTQPFFVLHMPPTLLVKLDDVAVDLGLGPGIIAVEAKLSEPFKVTVEIPSSGGAQQTQRKSIEIRARRKQLPVTITTASTLYTLQGTTATPGLLYHVKAPQRLTPSMKWTAVYMALSRVRSL